MIKQSDNIPIEIYMKFLRGHGSVMRDEITMLGFKAAFEANAELLKGAVVLEVNCGSALLSLWAAKFGAARVIAVDSSDVSHIARQLVRENQLDHVIEVLQGELQDLQLPPIDVIISKWMGACLMYSSALEAVIYARDKWLKPGGIILPQIANLYMTAAENPRNPLDNNTSQYWTRYSGLNLSHAWRITQRTPLLSCLDATQVLSQRQLLQSFDMKTIRMEDLSFTVRFQLHTLRQSIAKWFVLYFDFRFRGMRQLKPISTSPNAPATQWKQTLFHIDTHLPLCVGDHLCGQFTVKRSLRHLDFDIDWSFHNELVDIRMHKQIYRMQDEIEVI